MYEVVARQEVLDAIYEEVFVDRQRKADGDKPIEPVDISPELQEKLRKALESDPALKAKYTTPAPIGERSDREFHLCGKLYAAGFNEGEIYAIMKASPQRKWRMRGDDYRIATIRRAIEAEKSAASSEVDKARKTLKGLEESVKADPSAINRREVLQALAVLKRSDPIGYGIVIDGLGLTQTVKPAVKKRVKKIVNEQHIAEKKPQKEQTEPEIRQKALEILKIGKAIQFILDVLKLFHAGDRRSAELLLLSIAIGSCLNAYGTQPKLSGGSGKGKTHLCKAIRHLMPQEWILYTSLSPKALYRATDPASPVQIKPGMIILSDDVRIGEDMEDTLKRSMTNFQEPSWHLVVQDGELKRLYIPPRVIWWLTSVLDDQEEQLINRFFSVGIDESSAQDQAALELTFAPLADGRVEFPLTEDVLVCREIIRIIKSERWIVWAPFIRNGKELAVAWANPEERRNPGRFADLLAAYAILQSGQREVIDEGGHLKVIATVDDFYSAKALYESRAENLTTKLSDDELHMVRWLNEKAKNEIYEFTINGMAKEYKGRDGKGLSSKTIERRLLGRIEKGHMSYGLIHKIKGGGLIVERKSETEDLGMRKNQKNFYLFTFDPSKFNLLDTYGNVVALKTTEQTHKTPADQGSGSAPITPQDVGLEEEKNRKTEQTKNTRGVEVERRTLGCEIFKKKSQLPSQDGSDGSFRSLLEPDIDPLVVSPGSTRGSEPCQGCGQPAEDLIDLPGGRFCEACVAKFAEEDRARKATPVGQPPKLKAIYKPNGEAREYADLALNIYSGCSHDCTYCYNKYRFNGSCDQRMKKATLDNIESDLKLLAESGDERPVHLSFVGDPYDVGRSDNSYTRQVLELFRKYNYPFQTLTKGGLGASMDFDLYGPEDRFGVTLTFSNEEDSKLWEPGAALPKDRIEALRQAHDRGIKTWVSLEPVIDPEQSLKLIEMTHLFVDDYGLGKLNHCLDKEKTIDWHKYLADAEKLLEKFGKWYKVKQALVDAAAEQQEVQEDGVADKQPRSQPADNLPGDSCHQLMWKRPSMNGEQKPAFTPEENELLLRMVGKIRHQRVKLKAFILADFVRYTKAIPPGRCREWFRLMGGVENPQGDWALPDDVLAQADLLNEEFQRSGDNPSFDKHTMEDN